MTDTAATWLEATHVLKNPVNVEGRPATGKITLREPSVEALEKLEEVGFTSGSRPTIKQTREAICILSGEEEITIKALSRSDFVAVTEKLGPLMGAVAEE